MPKVLVTGGTGFVGRALLKALVAAGHEVRATTRELSRGAKAPRVEWVRCDVDDRADVERALEGIDAAYFLVHGMGAGQHDYAAKERHAAAQFAQAAGRAGVKRIIYLGGVAPVAKPSEHLKSRLEVGELLRSGPVPTLELRASMIIGTGSASWQIVRDLAMRLPAMVLPSWTNSRTCPVAIEDVTVALVRGLDLPLPASAWYDIPGPDVLSGRDILLRLAALRGRRVPSVRIPLLSVSLSSWWLKLVTRTDFSLARELVLGFTDDLLPHDARYWKEIGYEFQWTFDQAARAALEQEVMERNVSGVVGKLGEAVVQLVSPKLTRPPAHPSPASPRPRLRRR
jgi:uncharacterized protein YbjT (DUF2867 family)